MKRDISRLSTPISDMTHIKVGLLNKSDYYVDGDGYKGQDKDDSVLDYNAHPTGQPGLWCKWSPNEEGTEIEWNGVEKFYDYIEWIKYLIEHFLSPWSYVLNGKVEWFGEEPGDMGVIEIKDNVVKVKRAKITYEED